MAARRKTTSVAHGKGRKPKETAAQKAEKKVLSYIHGHRRHGSPLAPAARMDAWRHVGQARRQG